MLNFKDCSAPELRSSSKYAHVYFEMSCWHKNRAKVGCICSYCEWHLS